MKKTHPISPVKLNPDSILRYYRLLDLSTTTAKRCRVDASHPPLQIGRDSVGDELRSGADHSNR